MLVLSRKIGQEVVIGDNIRVTVLSIVRNQVRLGVTAPAAVAIRREELEATSAPLAAEARSEVSPNTG